MKDASILAMTCPLQAIAFSWVHFHADRFGEVQIQHAPVIDTGFVKC